MLRHSVPAEVPDVLLAAHFAWLGVFGVGSVPVDARARLRAAMRVVLRRQLVHGAGGWVPSAADRAVAGGVPAVLAQVHHEAPHPYASRCRRIRLPGGPVCGGCRRVDAVQPCAFRQLHRFWRKLQPDGERYDEARLEYRPLGAGAVRVFLAAAQRHRRVPVSAGGAV